MAGYYSKILSGLLWPVSIALARIPNAKLPPAESPVKMIFLGTMLK